MTEQAALRLFYYPEGKLRLEQEDRCWLSVRPTWAAPMSHPNRYMALLDGKDKEITLIPDPQTLDAATWAILKEELDRRYLSARVMRIDRCNTEFGATYWQVLTDRGPKEFVTQSLQENAQWMTPTQLLLIDVDGNRFEITDTQALDEKSRARLFATV
jgi:hypothetical protein